MPEEELKQIRNIAEDVFKMDESNTDIISHIHGMEVLRIAFCNRQTNIATSRAPVGAKNGSVLLHHNVLMYLVALFTCQCTPCINLITHVADITSSQTRRFWTICYTDKGKKDNFYASVYGLKKGVVIYLLVLPVGQSSN